MTTKDIRRIQFYTRKAAEYLEQQQDRPLQLKRLTAYRTALARRLEAKGYRWRPAVDLGKYVV